MSTTASVVRKLAAMAWLLAIERKASDLQSQSNLTLALLKFSILLLQAARPHERS